MPENLEVIPANAEQAPISPINWNCTRTISASFTLWRSVRMADSAPFPFIGLIRTGIRSSSGWMANWQAWYSLRKVQARCGTWRSFSCFADFAGAASELKRHMKCSGGFLGCGKYACWKRMFPRGIFGWERYRSLPGRRSAPFKLRKLGTAGSFIHFLRDAVIITQCPPSRQLADPSIPRNSAPR